MATNWVDEILTGATSTGSKTLSLATGNVMSVANSESESIFTVTSDTTNGGFTSVLGIEGQEAVLFLGADNADDAGDVWEIQSDTSGNFKIGNRTSGTGSPARGNTITNAITIDTSRNITVGVDDTGYDVKFFGATSGQYLLWDESADELVLAGDTKLSFHDAAGGENIIASGDGHLEINAGTTLDITAPTVDVNVATELNIDGNVDLNGTLDVSSTSTLTGLVTATAGVKLGNNIIYASDGGQTITLDTSDNVTITGDLTVTGADITIGADADGTDRNIVFGHSTLKTIMGIDDSADAFVINTDAAFDGTLANNSFSIDASHNIITGGNLTIAGDLTVSGGDIDLSGEASTVNLIDNNSDAIQFGSAGSTDTVTISTADSQETMIIDGDRANAGVTLGCLTTQGSAVISGTPGDDSNLGGIFLESPTFVNTSGTNTIARHSYIKVDDIDITNTSGTCTVTDVCLFDFENNLNTSGSCTTNSDKTGNAKSGTIKINVNGTIYHLQLYAN